MNTYYETDTERVVKIALAREMNEKHLSGKVVRKKGSELVKPLSNTFAAIVVPTDLSPSARLLVNYAYRLAKQFGAQLTLLHVTDPITYAPAHCPSGFVAELRRARQRTAMEALNALIRKEEKEAKGVRCVLKVREGHPAIETALLARECEADLIVLSTHGYTGLKHLLLGSTAEKIVRYAPCFVLVVPEKELQMATLSEASSLSHQSEESFSASLN